MTHSLTQRLGACLLVTLMTSATSFAADRPAPAPPRPTLLASAQKQVQQLAKMAPPATARSAQAGTQGYDEPGSFFSTKRGVALLVLAGAGVGYMWYSKVHDRIHSVARERLDN